MSLIETVYASAPSDYVIIPSLEILITGADPIRLVSAYKDYDLTDENNVTHTYMASGFDYKEPAKNTSGQQSLAFAIANVTGEAQTAVEQALNSDDRAQVILRFHLSTDLGAPAKKPIKMVMTGGTFEGNILNINASYVDILNYAWPRERYTNSLAPGLRYI